MYTMFSGRSKVFYDLDTKTTFTVSKKQWDAAKEEYKNLLYRLEVYGSRGPIYISPRFIIRTETGIHYNWIYRKDQDYREDHVRGIR